VSSARAALLLVEMGFLGARALRGGIAAWREAGHPLEPVVTEAVPLRLSTEAAPR
jgi:rhodanese-related sulfurtransferase